MGIEVEWIGMGIRDVVELDLIWFDLIGLLKEGERKLEIDSIGWVVRLSMEVGE